MSTVDRKWHRDARRRARAEASAWVVRLHGPRRSPALEAGFREWLAADPEHARQFERVTEVWDAGAHIPIGGVPRVRTQGRARAAWIWAAAASIALACLATAYFFIGVQSGTVYRTAIGPLRVIQLGDGSRVSLDAQSEVRVTYSDTERRVQLDYGEAYFQVSHNPGWPFVVVAGTHQVTDIGTAFVVRYGSDRTAVTLIKGRVAVSSRTGAAGRMDGAGLQPSRLIPIILSPGQRLTFAGQGPPQLDEPRTDDVTAWLRGEITLDNTPLSRVVAALNRYDATALRIEDPSVARLRVSGIYHTGDNREFAFLLGKLYGVRYSERGGRIILGAGPNPSR